MHNKEGEQKVSKIDLKGNPFFLSDEDIKWVNETKDSLSVEEKIGQLFFTISMSNRRKDLEKLQSVLKPGGMMSRPASANKIVAVHKIMQSVSKVPMIFGANTEAGGNGLVSEGTYYGSNMQVGASNDEENAYKLGLIAAKEAMAVGGNMAFAPVIDINYNFRNPITNTRAFGDRPELVAKMGAQYVKGAQDGGSCVTIKHFPGDGTDGRDQHLVTTRNILDIDEWMATYGKAYKESIEAGARGLMVGHITLPKYMDKVQPDKKELRNLPATLNEDLLEGLLRKELGYNGLTLSDSTLMTGFGQQGKRSDLVPMSIAAGCDMFLTNRMPEDDYNHMMEGYKNGVITEERLDDALTRILALKASLKLHNKTVDELVPDSLDKVDLQKHKQWTKELADKSITLVKDEQNTLPLDPKRHKKIGIIFNGSTQEAGDILNNIPGFKGFVIRTMSKLANIGKPKKKLPMEVFMNRLKEKGFNAFEFDFADIITVMNDALKRPLDEWKKQFDVIIYFVQVQSASNQTTLQIGYKAAGFDAPWFVEEIPTITVSVGTPYVGYSMEMVKTIINGYSSSDEVCIAIADKIAGESEFKGVSPVKLDFKEFTRD